MKENKKDKKTEGYRYSRSGLVTKQNRKGLKIRYGELINEFDNEIDNSIKAFNTKFEESIGGCQLRQVEILEPFTHNGRILRIDDGPKFQFLFNDESTGIREGVGYDVYNKNNEFIQRYRKVVTIARDYQVDASNVLTWFSHSYANKYGLRVEKICLKTGKVLRETHAKRGSK
jgi:hypothetical protein